MAGSVARANGRLRSAAQLIRADSGAIVWAIRTSEAGDVLSLQNEVVIAIAREWKPPRTGTEGRG